MSFLGLFRIALAALFLALVGSPALGNILTAAEWKSALTAAKPGDTIDLGTKEVQFVRQTLAPVTCCVTIKGGIFKGLVTLDTWKNVIFDGSRFEDTTNQGTYAFLVLAYNPENVTWRNSEFVGSFFNGAYQVNSLSIRGGKNLTFQKNKFHDLSNFLQFKQTDGVLFEDNDLWNIREGIQLPGTQNARFLRNKIGPFVTVTGDHADGFQIFMNGFNLTDKTILSTGNIVIKDNLIIANTGLTRRAQCMLFQDEQNFTATGRPIHDLLVEGNTCLATGWHGISMNAPGAVNVTIQGNQLIHLEDPTDPIKANWILTKPGTNIVVRNNVASRISLDPTTIASGNTVSTVQPTPAEYAKVIADWDAKYRPAAPSATDQALSWTKAWQTLQDAQKALQELGTSLGVIHP